MLDRTQGWAAGLRLAVLSLHPGDVDGAIDRFTGSDGLVAEYLIEEVLDRVPAADRQFLLATSVAERISPPLANNLTGRADSQHVLKRLVAQNALLLELAGGSEWFGFHPMLRELLLRRLELEQPGRSRIFTGVRPAGSRRVATLFRLLRMLPRRRIGSSSATCLPRWRGRWR